MQLKRLLPLLPDVQAVVMLVGINDLMLRLSKDRNYDPGFLLSEGAEEKLLARAFEVLPLNEVRGQGAWQKTALWRFASRIKDSWFESNKVQDEAGDAIVRWRGHRRSAPEYRDRLPDLSSALLEYERNIKELIRICRESKSEPIFMTQPSIWREGFPEDQEWILWMGGIGDYLEQPGSVYYSIGMLGEAMEKYNTVLLATCESEGVDCLDLASTLPKDLDTFYDDVHFNKSGAQRVRDALGAYLLERPPFGAR